MGYIKVAIREALDRQDTLLLEERDRRTADLLERLSGIKMRKVRHA